MFLTKLFLPLQILTGNLVRHISVIPNLIILKCNRLLQYGCKLVHRVLHSCCDLFSEQYLDSVMKKLPSQEELTRNAEEDLLNLDRRSLQKQLEDSDEWHDKVIRYHFQ